MRTQPIIFAPELRNVLPLPAASIRILQEFGILPNAKRVPGTCIFYYDKEVIEAIVDKLANDRQFIGRIEYLLSIEREE